MNLLQNCLPIWGVFFVIARPAQNVQTPFYLSKMVGGRVSMKYTAYNHDENLHFRFRRSYTHI